MKLFKYQDIIKTLLISSIIFNPEFSHAGGCFSKAQENEDRMTRTTVRVPPRSTLFSEVEYSPQRTSPQSERLLYMLEKREERRARRGGGITLVELAEQYSVGTTRLRQEKQREDDEAQTNLELVTNISTALILKR